MEQFQCKVSGGKLLTDDVPSLIIKDFQFK